VAALLSWRGLEKNLETWRGLEKNLEMWRGLAMGLLSWRGLEINPDFSWDVFCRCSRGG
jgi:hypothetical protein